MERKTARIITYCGAGILILFGLLLAAWTLTPKYAPELVIQRSPFYSHVLDTYLNSKEINTHPAYPRIIHDRFPNCDHVSEIGKRAKTCNIIPFRKHLTLLSQMSEQYPALKGQARKMLIELMACENEKKALTAIYNSLNWEKRYEMIRGVYDLFKQKAGKSEEMDHAFLMILSGYAEFDVDNNGKTIEFDIELLMNYADKFPFIVIGILSTQSGDNILPLMLTLKKQLELSGKSPGLADHYISEYKHRTRKESSEINSQRGQ